MSSAIVARKLIQERGPRYAITGTIRPGEAVTEYADTPEQAARIAEQMQGWGYYQVQAHPPAGSVDLGKLRLERENAKAAFDEATAVLRAGVLRALEEGRTEVEVAATAGVDRMTVRKWAGKQ